MSARQHMVRRCLLALFATLAAHIAPTPGMAYQSGYFMGVNRHVGTTFSASDAQAMLALLISGSLASARPSRRRPGRSGPHGVRRSLGVPRRPRTRDRGSRPVLDTQFSMIRVGHNKENVMELEVTWGRAIRDPSWAPHIARPQFVSAVLF